MSSDSGLPGPDTMSAVCRVFGVDGRNARQLHQRSNAVWLVDTLVVRLAPDTELRRERAVTALAVTRWLAEEGMSIALAPVDGEQPVYADGAVATFWPYRPSDEQPGPAELGELARRLHSVDVPPFSVPRYRPLRRLREALAVDEARAISALPGEDREWLREQADRLVTRFAATRFPLGEGLIHGDLHGENAVMDRSRWVLIDWDNAAVGPRELDLVGTLPDHFHEPDTYRRQFTHAYGYDLLDWPDWTLLRDITEFHSLGSYIRLAPSNAAAATELARRLRSLRTGDRSIVWQSVS
ncbi:aminoglycoside phosphotransferase family protein [Nocardia terpenica]|uniref:Aminoglycoside phosphotransferase domain-containing protein n=1 Tax=Nocardia terpenica TaxID=455432 RepID=A0A291RIY7_9NOCA|nr:aminoglycoside phosphotransferase family protein [Nocardia terpenica]ATL67238.1 hypothetical protein CRH09_14570 [Nocardia terpenica]